MAQLPGASAAPRVAFFPDTFYELADGVSNTSRRFEAYARDHNFPLLTICGSPRNGTEQRGSVTHVQFRRTRVGFSLEPGHDYDLLFLRHYRAVVLMIRAFRPDLIQITGPSDVGALGMLVAYKLRIPLAATFQTNVHEFARMRIANMLPRFLPSAVTSLLPPAVEHWSLKAIVEFYKYPRLLFAPNQELIDFLAKKAGKPCLLMPHGVDTAAFSPEFRDRSRDAGPRPLQIGYVGRLSAEKNLGWLARLEKELLARGLENFQFVVVGTGVQETWLRQNLRNAVFTGLLQGEALSRAFANMDIFAFPSETDTFGLVVLEALSSGVPAVVTDRGGPKYTVQNGRTGFVSGDFDAFASNVVNLLTNEALRTSMGRAAREYAVSVSWDDTFETMYAAYDRLLLPADRPCAAQMAYDEAKS
jgi:phosphatidylinositol alpha 1,6-mannosyltransferase